MSALVKLILIAAWVAGIVLAKGIWSSALAVIMPLYSWYLIAERIMEVTGLIK